MRMCWMCVVVYRWQKKSKTFSYSHSVVNAKKKKSAPRHNHHHTFCLQQYKYFIYLFFASWYLIFLFVCHSSNLTFSCFFSRINFLWALQSMSNLQHAYSHNGIVSLGKYTRQKNKFSGSNLKWHKSEMRTHRRERNNNNKPETFVQNTTKNSLPLDGREGRGKRGNF